MLIQLLTGAKLIKKRNLIMNKTVSFKAVIFL